MSYILGEKLAKKLSAHNELDPLLDYVLLLVLLILLLFLLLSNPKFCRRRSLLLWGILLWRHYLAWNLSAD